MTITYEIPNEAVAERAVYFLSLKAEMASISLSDVHKDTVTKCILQLNSVDATNFIYDGNDNDDNHAAHVLGIALDMAVAAALSAIHGDIVQQSINKNKIK